VLTKDMSLLLLWMNRRGASRDYDSGPGFQLLTAVNFPENDAGPMNRRLLRDRARR